MYIVPRFQHLRDVEIKVDYRELQILGTPTSQKWKSDPDTLPGQTFIPQPKYYVNGVFVRQGNTLTKVLRQPPPLDKFPRRDGVSRVEEHDPDFEEQCRKQRLPGYHASSASSDRQQSSVESHQPELTNDMTPPRSDKSRSANGGSPHHGSVADLQTYQLPNGVPNGGSIGSPSHG